MRIHGWLRRKVAWVGDHILADAIARRNAAFEQQLAALSLRDASAPPQIIKIPAYALERGKVYVMLIDPKEVARSTIPNLNAYFHDRGIDVLIVETFSTKAIRFIEVERPTQQTAV